MNNHKILVFSSSFFIAPFLYLYLFVEKPDFYELLLSVLLLFNFVLSVMFWHNPIKRSFVHRIDGFMAKLIVVLMFIYIAFIKEIEYFYKFIFYGFYLLFISMARLSNIFSRKEWRSRTHIFYHFLMHLCGIFGFFIAFI
jgi:hypothetical protein